MTCKQLSVLLCDIKQNPSEEVLSFCKSPSLFSELFAENRMLLKKCQIQEEQEDHIHGTKGTLRNVKSVKCTEAESDDSTTDGKCTDAESDDSRTNKEQEDDIHGRKRTLRNLKREEQENHIHDRKGTLKNLKSGKFTKAEADDSRSDKEQEDDIHGRKRTLRNLKRAKYIEAESGDSTSDEKYTETESDDSTTDEDCGSDSERNGCSLFDENSDSDFERIGDSLWGKNSKQDRKRRKNSVHKENSEQGRKKKKVSVCKRPPLSDYEKMIAEKNKERLAILSSLGIIQAKNDFCETVSSLKPKPAYKKKENEIKVKVQERCSQRLAKQTYSINFDENALIKQSIKKQKEELMKEADLEKILKETEKERKERIKTVLLEEKALKVCPEKIQCLPPKMSFKEALEYPKPYENYCENFCFENSVAEFTDISYNRDVLKNLAMNNPSFVKVLPDPTVLAWYPSSEDLILAAGNRCGQLSIFKLGFESGPCTFKPHVGSITNLLFNPFNPVHMVTSSRDGSVRCADLLKHTFMEIYNVSSNAECSYFDFLSVSTCLVAQNNGEITLIDYRTDRLAGEIKHQCHKVIIHTVHGHPVNKYNFVTASMDKRIRLWDLRMLQKNNAPATYNHKSSARCAYFSPVTGNSILSASQFSIRITDSEDMSRVIERREEVVEENKVYIRNVKWLPNSESMYVVNPIKNSSSIKVNVKSTEICHIIGFGEGKVKGLNIFHPCKPLLAGVDKKDNFFYV